MKTVTIKFNKTKVSNITTSNLRKNFPCVYRSIFKRIGTDNIIFTKEIRSFSGKVVTEPYIILTKSNKVFEIKECGAYFYLDLVGDDEVGQMLRTEYDRTRYEMTKRSLKKQTAIKRETALAA